jgi:molybdopterin-biosynthesis enzyme MoeA-like protein
MVPGALLEGKRTAEVLAGDRAPAFFRLRAEGAVPPSRQQQQAALGAKASAEHLEMAKPPGPPAPLAATVGSAAAQVAAAAALATATAAFSTLTTFEAALQRDIAALEADKSAEVARRAKATEETNKAAAAVMASAKAEADALVKDGHDAVKAARAELDKDRALFEDEKKKMATIVKSSEVISLNVGGTSLAVLRSTLTSVEGSMLAGMFSGRWESSLVKDKHGDVFVSCSLLCGGRPRLPAHH